MHNQPTTRRRVRLLTLALAGLAAGYAAFAPDDGPSVRWLGGDSAGAIEPMATLPAAYPLALELELPRPMYVYVASHDLVRGTIAMFPSTMLRSDLPANPLPAGRHTLPGTLDGADLRWHAGDGVGATSLMIIASPTPRPDLATVLERCRQMGNAAFRARPLLDTYAPADGMAATPPRHEVPHPLLRAAHGLLDPLHDGPLVELPGHDGVLAKVLRVETAPRTPATAEDAARDAVRARLAPLEDLPAPPAGR